MRGASITTLRIVLGFGVVFLGLACSKKDPLGPCAACPPGFSCHENACRMSCVDDADCGPTGECIDGFCGVQCGTGADCPAFTDDGCTTGAPICNTGLCEYTGACPAELVCIDATCTDRCTGDDDCEPAERCDVGGCVAVDDPGCDQNSDCTNWGAGAICQGGLCHAVCSGTDDCPLAQSCAGGFCFAVSDCSLDNQCTATQVCAGAGSCTAGSCIYPWLGTGASCDDNNPCTTGTSCTAAHLCSGGNVDIGAPCTNGICVDDSGATCSTDQCLIAGTLYDAGAVNPANPCASCNPSTNRLDWTYRTDGSVCAGGFCLPPTPADGTGLCRDDVCNVGGVIVADGQGSPANPCALCDVDTSTTAWQFEAVGDACTMGGGGAGLCLPPPSGPDPVTCRNDQCRIGGVIYDDGTDNPATACEECDPSQGQAYLTDWFSLVGRDCPLGCATTPALHCVEPSNWGYWDGTTPHRDGVTLAWIEADAGGSQSLTISAGTVTIDTGSSGAPTISGVTLAATDYKIVPQSTFHQAGNAAPGLPTPPDLVAIKFKSINVTGGTIICSGARPLALASMGSVNLGGAWTVTCGGTSAGSGQAASAQPSNRYNARGGGGGGFFGSGGASAGGGQTISGGGGYGRAELQPLAGGSPGGAGAGQKGLDTTALGGNEGNAQCWFFSAEGTCPSSGTFNGWLTNTWNNVPQVGAGPGQGGGAIQVVSLAGLSLQANIDASGEPGDSVYNCAANTYPTFNGGLILDRGNYPVKYPCSTCGDGSAAARSWTNYVLQTGGGGGSGGAVLIEGATVAVSPTARVRVYGGGGGGACYMNGFTGDAGDLAGPNDLGAHLMARYAGTVAGFVGGTPADGPTGAVVNNYGTWSGGAGGLTGAGGAASFGSANPSNETHTFGTNPNTYVVEQIAVPAGQNVAWGGGGGSAGRIRVNSVSGTFTCGGDCSPVFEPAAAGGCGSAPSQVCAFPSSGTHYKN